MPITIKYDPEYSLVGRVAYATGTGQAEERSQIRQQQAIQAAQARADALAREASDQQIAQQRIDAETAMQDKQLQARSADQAVDDRQRLAEQHMAFEQAAKMAELNNQNDVTQIYAHGQVDQANRERTYTFQQNQERQKILDAKARWNNDPSIDLVTKQKGNRLLDFQLNGINPQDIQKSSPWPDGQDVGQTWRDDSGALLTRDVQGNVKVLQKPADHGSTLTMAESVKVYSDKAKLVTDLMTANPDMGYEQASQLADRHYWPLEHSGEAYPAKSKLPQITLTPQQKTNAVWLRRNSTIFLQSLHQKVPDDMLESLRKIIAGGTDEQIIMALSAIGVNS